MVGKFTAEDAVKSIQSSVAAKFEIHRGVVIGPGPWENVGMASRKKRIPKQGDHVVVLGHNGAFVISSVDGDLCTAELTPTGRGLALSTIPWSTLTFLDEEDASQAAARIVRKATKGE